MTSKIHNLISAFDTGEVKKKNRKKKLYDHSKSLEMLPGISAPRQNLDSFCKASRMRHDDHRHPSQSERVKLFGNRRSFRNLFEKKQEGPAMEDKRLLFCDKTFQGSQEDLLHEEDDEDSEEEFEELMDDGLDDEDERSPKPPTAGKTKTTNGIPPPGASFDSVPFGHTKVPFDQLYKLGDAINSGFFGTVYKGHHVLLSETAQVAIKIVDRLSKEDDQIVIEEAKILKGIRDIPNLTRLFDFYMDEEKMYIVQELAAGGDVFDRLLDRKTYTENDGRELATHLLKIMQSLHERKMIHRDLKPENLLLKSTKSDSNILLCDFGLSKYLPSDGSGLWTHCGTPVFTAPEIVLGVEYWEEVDMWSIGCILFMLLGGYQPFEGSDSEVYQYISTADYGFDGPVWEPVSEEVKDLISHLLILDKKDRLSASQALHHHWFSTSTKTLQSNDLSETKQKIKHYCETVRPPDLHYIDKAYTGDEDFKYTEPEAVNSPQIGDSLMVDPLGSLTVPFDDFYELDQLISAGEFASFYEVHHLYAKHQPRVCVRICNKNEVDVEAHIYEASILKGIRGLRGVLRLYDFYLDRKKIYCVHELTVGEDVFDRLLERKIYQESEARKLAKNLISTIQSMHAKKLLHRNLKPENLMLRSLESDSDIVLAGLAYAKYLPSGNGGEGLWSRCGTPAFVAPEIVEGIEYWEEVDMWSVGCILFMLLGGYQPFEGDNEIELYQLICSANYRFDDPTWDVVSGQAKALISKLLVTDRKDRLTATQALEHEWFANNAQLHSSIPWVGESLKVEPLGSICVPFENVYKLGDLILEGSFGVMHKAHHVSMQPTDEVSVKIIDRKGDYVEAYIRDTSILKGINDLQHVLKLLDFYMDDFKMYVVYDNTATGDVFQRLSEIKNYDERDARDLFKIFLKAVQGIHARKLVHRNLKPENLILKSTKSNSDILVGGFGCAKYLPSGDESGCGLYTFCGTPAFTAPEILEGIEYFEEVDMWSAGCTLFQLLCGSRPFMGETTYETYDLISRADYGFDGAQWNNVSNEAKSLISSLLVLDRKKRLKATKALESVWFSISL